MAVNPSARPPNEMYDSVYTETAVYLSRNREANWPPLTLGLILITLTPGRREPPRGSTAPSGSGAPWDHA